MHSVIPKVHGTFTYELIHMITVKPAGIFNKQHGKKGQKAAGGG